MAPSPAQTHLERLVLPPVHDVEQQGGDDVKALAVPDTFVPAGVGKQYPLQNHPVLLVVLPAEAAAPRPVQVLPQPGTTWDKGQIRVLQNNL